MEGAERETIDAGDNAVLLIEPSAKRRERGRHGEFLRGEIAEAEAEHVGLAGRDAVTHAQRVVAQTSERLHPPFAAMDVGAVGEGKSGRELHAGQAWAAGALKRLFCERNFTGLP